MTNDSRMSKTIVLRRWSSKIRTSDREAYTSYVESTGVGDYAGTTGNLGFQMLLRDLGDGTTEVETLSWWTSEDAIRAFAGREFWRARYYPEDDRYLLEKPEYVAHFDVVLDGMRDALKRARDV